MTAPHLDAIARPGDDTTDLCAPRLGAFAARVSVGSLVGEGDVIGTVTVLTRRYAVRVPAGLTGRVTQVHARERGAGVEWGEPVVTVAPIDASVGPANAPGIEGAADLPAGAVVYEAPMDGQFYRRPSPDEPMFANVDDVLAPGATIGLIEVMKFFYPVTWDGDSPVRVVRVMADDATSVEAGAPLLIVVPVAEPAA